jgi:glycosyltransferase involved in cell wall biosynthesis
MVDVSVILATRNEKKFIGRTLRRVLEASDEAGRQGLSTEIIVVDNSTDGTFTEARKYVESVYTFVPTGVSKARNFGASLAKGSILIFMDADTTLQKSSLFDAVKEFKDGAAVSVVSRVLPLSRQKTLSTVLFYVLDGLYIRLCGHLNFLMRFYNRGDMTAIRKDVFERINGFNERLPMLEITGMLMKASSYGRIKVLPSPVFESSRRLRQWGLLKSYKVWWRNYFCFYILGHLYDSKYEACRGRD